MKGLASLLCAGLAGALFASGLILSGMTDPLIVRGFLDVTGQWRGELIWVMVGALLIAIPLFQLSKTRQQSCLQLPMDHPTATQIDARLLLGSALFGIGWGILGLCPAPALVHLAAGHQEALYFVLAMLLGFYLVPARRG